MATERIIIEISENGAKLVSRNIKGVGKAAKTSATNVNILGKALGLVGGAIVVRKILGMADAMNQFRNRLVVVSSGVEQSARLLDKLFESAQRTRTSFAGNVNLFARLAISAGDLVDSEDELLKIVEDINKAIIISGTNAAEASAGLIQLTQGFAAGVLRGDEFRSVSEQLIGVMQVLQRATGLTRGELRALAFDQKLTAELIIESFKDQTEFLATQFAKTIPTLSQSFERLSNAMTKTIGDMDAGSGATRALARSINFLADNMDMAIRLTIVLGSILLSALAGKALHKGISVTIALVRSLSLASAANPFLAIFVGASAVISSLVVFGDKIKLTKDGIATLEDFFVVSWRNIVKSIKESIFWLKHFVMALQDLGVMKEFETDTKGVILAIGGGLDDLTGLILGVPKALFLGLASPLDLLNVFIVDLAISLLEVSRAANEAGISIAKLATKSNPARILPFISEDSLNKGLDKQTALMNKRIDAAIALLREKAVSASAKLLTKEIQAALNPTAIADALNENLDQAEKQAEDRINALNAADALKGIGDRGDTEGLAKRLDSFNKLKDQILSVSAAERKLADSEVVLLGAVQDGIITGQQALGLQAIFGLQLQKNLEPMVEIRKEIQNNIKDLKEDSKEREISIGIRKIEAQVLKTGKGAAHAVAESFRELLVAEQKATEVSQVRDKVMEEAIGRGKEIILTQKTINALLKEETIGPQQAEILLSETSARNQLNTSIERQQKLRSTDIRQRGVELKFLQERDKIVKEEGEQTGLSLFLLRRRIALNDEAAKSETIRNGILDSTVLASERLIETQEQINSLVNTGELTPDAGEILKDELTVRGKLNASIREQSKLRQFNTDQREVEERISREALAIAKDENITRGEAIFLIREKIVANEREAELSGIRDDVVSRQVAADGRLIEKRKAVIALSVLFGRLSPQLAKQILGETGAVNQLNTALGEEATLRGKQGIERKIETRFIAEKKKLIDELKDVSEGELVILREKIALDERANAVTAIQDDLFQKITQTTIDRIEKQKQINALFREQEIGPERRDLLLEETSGVVKLNAQLKRAAVLRKVDPKDREVEIEVLRRKLIFLKDEIELNERHTALLRRQVESDLDAVDADAFRTQALKSFGLEQDEVIKRLKVIKGLEDQREGGITSAQADLLRSELLPLNDFTDALAENLELSMLSSRERKIQIAVEREYARAVGLSAVGIEVNIGLLEDLIRANAKDVEVNERRIDFVESFRRAQKNFTIDMLALRAAVDLNQLSGKEYTLVLQEINLELLATDRTIRGGLQRGLIELQKAFDDLGTQVEGALVGSFHAAEDALVDFFATGKFEMREFANVIIAEMTRIAIRALILDKIAGFLGSLKIFGGAGRGVDTGNKNIIPGRDTHDGGKPVLNRASAQQGDASISDVSNLATGLQDLSPFEDIISKNAAQPFNQDSFERALGGPSIIPPSPSAVAILAPTRDSSSFMDEAPVLRQDGATGSPNITFSPEINITVEGGGGSKQENDDLAGQISEQAGAEIQRQFAVLMKEFFKSGLVDEQRSGGILNRIPRV